MDANPTGRLAPLGYFFNGSRRSDTFSMGILADPVGQNIHTGRLAPLGYFFNGLLGLDLLQVQGDRHRLSVPFQHHQDFVPWIFGLDQLDELIGRTDHGSIELQKFVANLQTAFFGDGVFPDAVDHSAFGGGIQRYTQAGTARNASSSSLVSSGSVPQVAPDRIRSQDCRNALILTCRLIAIES